MHSTRRHFLQTVAASASLRLADGASLDGLAAFGSEPPPAKVQFGPDLEPIVRLIEDSPRDQCVAVFLDQLRRGLPYRRFLAGIFYAAVRRQDSNHEVYRMHSVHQVSMDARPEERLLPLFWALTTFKQFQHDFFRPPLAESKGPWPPSDKAAAEFADALVQTDVERADRALVALARAQGSRQTMEQFWQYGCRQGGRGGHTAIVVSNCFRTLETIGWHEAEPVLRFVLHDLHGLGAGKPDQYWAPNSTRADRHLGKLPPNWAAATAHPAATGDLFALLREGKAEQGCELAMKQLLDGSGAQAIWDAVHLATAELMVRHRSGWGLASRPLHSNTSTNALHYAFRTCSSPRTRLLVLLQAVGWAADKTRSDLSAGGLRDIKITELAPAAVPGDPEKAVAEIFAQLPLRYRKWHANTWKGDLAYGTRSDADEASRKVFALATQQPEATPRFVQAALSWLCRKANDDHHEYKFPAAILEDAGWVSPPWRPHLLAASVHYLHGEQSCENSAMLQVRDALKTLG